MTGRPFDIAIAGGGLAGGLAALALHRARPELRLALAESGEVLGGSGEELGKLMREDLKKWNAVATQAGIKPE